MKYKGRIPSGDLLWALVLVVLVVALIAGFLSGPVIVDAQISPVPTSTFTPIPSLPTNTPISPTNTPPPPTNTPPLPTYTPPPPTNTPPPPTNTPPPPTNTPPPVPAPPLVGPIGVDPADGVAQVDAPVDVLAFFSMPSTIDLDLVVWDWGDSSASTCPPGTTACAVDLVDGKVTGSHTYIQPGVYRVQLVVLDRFGQFGASTYEFVVAYDPGGGFVTGGGWIDSPAGAYKPDPSLTGKASFGFVSKYKKGAIYPTGHTGFRFQVADLNFQSDTYDWLVVTGRDYARFKGSGFINDKPAPCGEAYRFKLWAGDDEHDTFRIKIWWEDGGTENVVYDNGMNQPIGGGSVVVHAK